MYDDMVKHMENLVAVGGELNQQERNLLARSFHLATAARRKSWRIVSTTERSAEVRSNPALAHSVEEYKKKIESDIHFTCNRFLPLVNSKCITTDSTVGEKVFYHKLKGDLKRYVGDNKKKHLNFLDHYNALRAYVNSQAIATFEFSELDPARVHIELPLALFKYQMITEDGDMNMLQASQTRYGFPGVGARDALSAFLELQEWQWTNPQASTKVGDFWSSVSPWPNLPLAPFPHVNTSPLEVRTATWSAPHILC
ncbi:hypothetical protein V2J09_006059 [Rumex salicifolius]